MRCLVCHKKISRIRYWRTKSEFCSEEHAEQYKRQTLERLLRDQEALLEKTKAPPLPLIEDDDLETATAQQQETEGGVDRSHMLTAPEPDAFSTAESGGEFSSEEFPYYSQPEFSPQVEDGPSAGERRNDFADDPSQQTAEEALEALRRLSAASESSLPQGDEQGGGLMESRAEFAEADESHEESVVAKRSETPSIMDRLMEAESPPERSRSVRGVAGDLRLSDREFAEYLAGSGDTLPGEILVTPPPPQEDAGLAKKDEGSPEEASPIEPEQVLEGAARPAESRTDAASEQLPESEARDQTLETSDAADAAQKKASRPIPASLLSHELKSVEFGPVHVDIDEDQTAGPDHPVEGAGEKRELDLTPSRPPVEDAEEAVEPADKLAEPTPEPAEPTEERAAAATEAKTQEKVVPFPTPGERKEAGSSPSLPIAGSYEPSQDLQPLKLAAHDALAQQSAELPWSAAANAERTAVLWLAPELQPQALDLACRGQLGFVFERVFELATTAEPRFRKDAEWPEPVGESSGDLIGGGLLAEVYREVPLIEPAEVAAGMASVCRLLAIDPVPREGASDDGLKQQADIDMPALELRSTGKEAATIPLKPVVWKWDPDLCPDFVSAAPEFGNPVQHPVTEIDGDVIRSKVECRLPVASATGYGLSVQSPLIAEGRLHGASRLAWIEDVSDPEVPDVVRELIEPPSSLQLPGGVCSAMVGGRPTFPKVEQLLLAFMQQDQGQGMVEQPEEWEQWSAPYLEVETGRSHEGIEELEGQPLPDSQAELIGPLLAVRGPANLDPCEYA